VTDEKKKKKKKKKIQRMCKHKPVNPNLALHVTFSEHPNNL
jgi:hypothetical protein